MDKNKRDTDITNLMMSVSLLRRKIREAVVSNNLSWPQMTVLARLDLEGPATAAELARGEHIKPQSMGTTIGELLELGLVERQSHPTDGRQMIVKLTLKGQEVRKTVREEKRNWLVQAISKLDPEDQKILFAASEIFKRLVEE